MITPEADLLQSVKAVLSGSTVPVSIEGHHRPAKLPQVAIKLSSVQQQHQVKTLGVIKATVAIDVYAAQGQSADALAIGRAVVNNLSYLTTHWDIRFDDYSMRTLYDELNGQPVIRLAFLVDYLIYSTEKTKGV